MRIRKPFAGVFVVLVLCAGYLGLAPITIPYGDYHADKALHFLTFFLVSLSFYWIFETSRRRALNFSISVCTIVLGIGSEGLQGLLQNNRTFDFWDIGFNVVGSLTAIGICAWYHRRMLERRRAAKGYRASLGGDEELGFGENDVELGTGPQESGTTDGRKNQTMDEELDTWDENAADDWDEQPADRQDKSGDAAKK